MIQTTLPLLSKWPSQFLLLLCLLSPAGNQRAPLSCHLNGSTSILCLLLFTLILSRLPERPSPPGSISHILPHLLGTSSKSIWSGKFSVSVFLFRFYLPSKRHMFYPWVGMIPWRRKWKYWQPTPAFLPGKIPWTEEPSGLQSMGLERVRHNLMTKPRPPFPFL